MKRILLSPVTHLNVLIVGFFILVGVMHNHAHYSMEVDADSYVRQWCTKNPDMGKRYVESDDY